MQATNALFTTESARKAQAKSVIARERNKLAAKVTLHDTDIVSAVKRQIADILQDMERTYSRKEKARLTLMLEKLWNMVYPKAGARKPGRDTGRARTLPVAVDVATDMTTRDADTQNTQ